MTHRTDAAVRQIRRPGLLAGLAVVGLFGAGCLDPKIRFLAPVPPAPVPYPAPAETPVPPSPPATTPETPKPAVGPTLLTPAAAPKPPPPPSGEVLAAPTASPTDELQRLYREADAACNLADSYIARLRRRETVAGKAKPAEVIEFKFRRKPMAVHFKWLGKEGKGREVVYAVGRNDNKLHVRMAAGDAPFMPAGTRMALDPESPLVRNASRHSITEAGVGSTVAGFGQLLGDLGAGRLPAGSVRYLGKQKREEYDHPLDIVEVRLPAGREPGLPDGGTRLLCFDPQTHLPVLVVTKDAKGDEVEYYCFDRFQLDLHLDDADFDPEVLWPQKR